MRRFLITSKNYSGHVEVVYFNDVLHTITFAECSMIAAQRNSFKKAVPVDVNGLEEFVKQYKVVAVESDYVVTFDQFWLAYNKKVGKDLCKPVWAAMTNAERLAALLGIPKYNRFCERENNRARLDPVRYLKRKTWENEY